MEYFILATPTKIIYYICNFLNGSDWEGLGAVKRKAFLYKTEDSQGY